MLGVCGVCSYSCTKLVSCEMVDGMEPEMAFE